MVTLASQRLSMISMARHCISAPARPSRVMLKATVSQQEPINFRPTIFFQASPRQYSQQHSLTRERIAPHNSSNIFLVPFTCRTSTRTATPSPSRLGNRQQMCAPSLTSCCLKTRFSWRSLGADSPADTCSAASTWCSTLLSQPCHCCPNDLAFPGPASNTLFPDPTPLDTRSAALNTRAPATTASAQATPCSDLDIT